MYCLGLKTSDFRFHALGLYSMMEKKMETTIMDYIGTAIRIHSLEACVLFAYVFFQSSGLPSVVHIIFQQPSSNP